MATKEPWLNVIKTVDDITYGYIKPTVTASDIEASMDWATTAITSKTDRIEEEITKITKEMEKNKMKEVLFLAPSWQYVSTVINNLIKTFDKKKIPYTANSKKFETNSVRVTFVCSDPLKWTSDMFKDKTAIFGKSELRDKARELFPKLSMSIYKSSLEKYIIENTTSANEPQKAPPTSYLPEIKNVHFNGPATVVLWKDGTKTVVMCQEGDIYSEETGLALCIAKKAFGNMSNFNNIFRKWIPENKSIDDAWFEMMPNLFTIPKLTFGPKAKRNPVEAAYKKLVEFRDTDLTEDAELDIEELIGYLGEALE